MQSDQAFENLHDLRNETALLHLAAVDFAAYQGLALLPEDYFAGFHQTFAQLAADTYEAHGQAFAEKQLTRILTLGRDRKLITGDDESYAFRELMDPPLGVDPDPGKLRRHRAQRDQRQACIVAAKRIESGEADRALEALRGVLDAADARRESAGKTRTLDDALADWEADAARNEPGFSLGLRRLSHYVGDLYPGDVLVVGADTNVGKSTFVSEMMFASADAGTKWGYISMEDSERRYITRWISMLGGIAAKQLHRADDKLALSSEGRHMLRRYADRVFHAPLQGRTDQDVMVEMSAMARRGAQVIVVDYIGVVTCSSREQDRRNEIRAMLVRLKEHALRIGVALVVVSQLSRPRDKVGVYEPTKHDLKEAGDLENAAEFVVLLWRLAEHDFAPVKAKLAKSKDGNVGNFWWLQREMYAEDRYGNKRLGSARLREVVQSREPAWARDFPLLHEKDYEAVLAQVARG